MNGRKDDNDPHTPHASPVPVETDRFDSIQDHEAENRQEALVDEGLEETFPASDPVAAKRIT